MAPRLSSAVETVDQERRPGVSFKLTGANVIARIEKILIYFPVEKKDNKNKKRKIRLGRRLNVRVRYYMPSRVPLHNP